MTTINWDPIVSREQVRDTRSNEPQTANTSQRFDICNDEISEATPEQFLRLVENSGTLDFWDDPSEDIYSAHDGEPL